MMLSRVGSTGKILRGVGRLRAAAPSGSARTIQKVCVASKMQMGSFGAGTPRWVSPSLKRASVLTGIQPEGNILANLLLQKQGV